MTQEQGEVVVVTSRPQLLAAVEAALDDDAPLLVIEWQRKSGGVTRLRLRPGPVRRKLEGVWPHAYAAHYKAIARLIKRLPKECLA